MTLMDTLQLGIQSFQQLGLEFYATVSGSGPTGLDSVVCGLSERAQSGALQAHFYLNPFGQEHLGVNPACAGTDWISECIRIFIDMEEGGERICMVFFFQLRKSGQLTLLLQSSSFWELSFISFPGGLDGYYGNPSPTGE